MKNTIKPIFLTNIEVKITKNKQFGHVGSFNV